jgi:drug/metabolite transporter (DMT)-like permease
MSRRTTAYLLLLLTSVIWGIAPVVIKYTLASFDPLVFLSYRFGISTAVGLLILSLSGDRLAIKPKDSLFTFLYSITAITISLGLLFYGFDKTDSLTGNLLSATSPILVVFLGSLFLRDRVTAIEKTGIAIALAGALLTVFSPLFNGDGVAMGEVGGNVLILAAIFADAISVIFLKLVLRDRINPSLLAHISFTIGFLTILPITLAIHGVGPSVSQILKAPLGAHVGVLYMALLSGSLAYFLRNKAVRTIEVSEYAIFSYLHPIWGAPLSLLWLGEKITSPFLLGATIIAIGVVVAEHKRRRKRR